MVDRRTCHGKAPRTNKAAVAKTGDLLGDNGDRGLGKVANAGIPHGLRIEILIGASKSGNVAGQASIQFLYRDVGLQFLDFIAATIHIKLEIRFIVAINSHQKVE
jgi:hypothetical protein